MGLGEGQNLGQPGLLELGVLYRTSYLPTLHLGKLRPEQGHNLSKATEGVSVSSLGGRHGRKNCISFSNKLIV